MHVSPSKESNFSIIKDISDKYDLIIDVNMNSRGIKESIEILDNYYKVENEEIKNKIKMLINKTGT